MSGARISTRARTDRRRRRRLALKLTAGCGALLLACAARSVAMPETEVLPELEIAFEDPGEAREGVSARLRLGDAKVPAELDLEAWPPGSRGGARASMEVALKRKTRLFGMRRFSLRDPREVGFGSAFLVTAHLRREDVLVPRVRFVRVKANGVEVGLMALVEGFSKELPESQQRREGVLFRLEPKALPVARLDAYGGKKISDSAERSAERDTAAGLLQAFLRSELPAGEVFDMERMSRFLAVVELWQADDFVRAEGLRFYFNPVTQRIEPVGFGLRSPSRPDPEMRRVTARGWPSRLMEDPTLRAAVARQLRRLAGEMSAGTLPGWVAREGESALRALRAAGVSGAVIEIEPFRARARELVPLEETDLARGGREAGEARLDAARDVPSRRSNPVPRASLEEVLARHAFLEWDEGAKVLRAATGVWDVSGSLVLPEGVGLELSTGTRLRFGVQEMLLGTGPLRFRGTAEDPVVLEGIPAGPGPGTWQGIVVLRSDAPHEWSHVEVRGTRGIDRDGWRLTGGVTFRASEVRIESSSFSGNRAEDALNLIRSRFAFRDVEIRETASDAFDCDFCQGRVEGGRIHGVGGDGVDVSGSDVEVDGTDFDGIRDKAISVGEASRLTARNVRIRNVGTALAGKDGSEVVFEDSEVMDVSHAGIMAYIKKAEYGPGQVRARNIRMARVTRMAVAQHGSRIEIDGVEQASEDIDVEKLYERGPMKK